MQIFAAGLLSLLLIIIHSMQAGPLPPLTHTSPSPSQRPAPLQSGLSKNWAGYAATGGTFTTVSGTWTVPNISDTRTGGADATWVGIGGVSTDDLIQAGTQATVDPLGRVSYSAFYETLPDASVPLHMGIHPGDTVHVAIQKQSDNSWHIQVSNTSTGETSTLTTPYRSSLSSAEWIEEAPTGIRREIPLDNFGSVNISQATAVRNGKTLTAFQAGAKPIAMGSEEGLTLAEASILDTDGASFTVTRKNIDAVSQDSGHPVYLIYRSIPFFSHRHFHFGY